MKIKRLTTLLVVGLISLFLLTSGLSIAFRGNNSVTSFSPGVMGDDDNDDDNNNPISNITDDDDDDDDDENENDNGDDDEEDEDGDDSDDEQERERERKRERGHGVGRFWDDTNGTFISFELIENGIKDYKLYSNDTELQLFDSVRIQDLMIDEKQGKGAFYEIEGDDTEIRIYDVAPALMKMEVEADDDNRTVSFDLGDLHVIGNDGPNMLLSYENHTAKLLSVTDGDDGWNDSLDISIDNGFLNYTFEDELFLVFRMTGVGEHEREEENEREREMDENISKGISEGKVGGEISIDDDKEGVNDVSVTYSDMNMMTQVGEKNRLRVMVSSDTLEDNGKVVVVNVYQRVMNISNSEEMKVTFDGTEIDMAKDFSDLVDTSDGAEYLVSVGSDKVQVLVMVPHFSTHTIEILKTTGQDFIGNMNYYLPALIGTALIISSTVWIVQRKRR